MTGRLIGIIVIFAVLLGFIGFNLDNRCDISFGLIRLKQVPVFFTVFGSFFLGMLVSVPFLVSFAVKKKAPKTPKPPEKGANTQAGGCNEGGSFGA